VLAAAAGMAGAELSEEELFRLCCSIEPSDGTVFRGLALVDHLRGRLIERLPAPPSLWLATQLPFRTLDTDDYRKDRSLIKAVRDRGERHRRAYRILRAGLREGSPRKVSAAATFSAILQQAILPREEWPLLLAVCRECHGLGIAVAHSGTSSGVLFGSEEGARCALGWLKGRWDAGETRMVSVAGGGVELRREGN
jgi:L-threonine kinase